MDYQIVYGLRCHKCGHGMIRHAAINLKDDKLMYKYHCINCGYEVETSTYYPMIVEDNE